MIFQLASVAFVLSATATVGVVVGFRVAPPVWAGVLAGLGSWFGILFAAICLK